MSLWQYARAQWDRVGAGSLFALGGLALVFGWIGVSREALTALQIPYIVSGGLGGIFLLGLGAVFWLSADLRDEWRKLDAIERAMSGTLDEPDAEDQPAPAADAPIATNGSSRQRRQPIRTAS